MAYFIQWENYLNVFFSIDPKLEALSIGDYSFMHFIDSWNSACSLWAAHCFDVYTYFVLRIKIYNLQILHSLARFLLISIFGIHDLINFLFRFFTKSFLIEYNSSFLSNLVIVFFEAVVDSIFQRTYSNFSSSFPLEIQKFV